MELTCPVCGSDEVYRGGARRKVFAFWYLGTFLAFMLTMVPALFFVAILWAVFPLAFPFLENWHCRNCGARLHEG